MGGGAANSQHLLSALLQEFLIRQNPDLWRKLRQQQERRHYCSSSKILRCRSMVMKRRARLDRCIRDRRSAVERKVRILKKLIPNCDTMEMERVLRETADYIVALQMRVKLMQIMVDVLSGSDDHHHHDHDQE
ncbi:Transcription factor UPBEAT1 [Sesamum alatum]|uniref:Transcription factor UPBEAT1 n=1 Tax=Sesamum alatum TaxID=300844 RepID=A0AAE1XUW1_9LAMI|nr:Transcription factor UPBEAT1 [Sesamum alatum]